MDNIIETWLSAPNGQQLQKALQTEREERNKIVVPKSAIIDPYNSSMGAMGTRTKPTPVPYSTLRRMAQVPAVSAIILTRLNQVARFARRPRYDGDMGFRIVLKDKNRKMSEGQKKKAFEMEEFFLKTGAVKNRVRKDNFNQFLRKVVRDTLTLDTMTWEHVPTLKGDLAEIWAVDSATIELVPVAPVGDGREVPVYVPQTAAGLKIGGNIAYVQRLNGEIIAEYTEDELAYAIRNPRTDMDYTDFGMSELENLIEIVTGITNSVRYNTSYFSHSHLPQGVLEIVGKYKDEHLEAFRRHWKNLTSGASGKWSVPVFGMEEGQGLKFTPFKNSNRDMEFNEFLEFLFNIACAVYQIDPNEVGFKSWTSGNSMSASDNTAEKMEASKDKGFIPLMNFLSDTFNSEIVDRMDDEFSFEWVGVDEEDEDKKLERIEKRITMGLTTVQEERKVLDKEDILDEEGNVASWTTAPAQAQLIQVYMGAQGAQQQVEQQEQQQAQGEQERQQATEDGDTQHQRQLEVMDKQHQQSMEAKQADHKHQKELEAFKAKNAPKPAPGGGKLKKSLTEETDDDMDIVITWDNY